MRSTAVSRTLLLYGLACVVAACGKKEQPAPAAPQNEAASTALEGQVDIVAWAGYIERGESDKGYDWVTAVREGHRLQGQREDSRHVRRDGVADDPGRLRPRHRVRRCLAAPHPRRHGAAGGRHESGVLRQHRPAPEGSARGTTSTASTTACRTSGARTCSCTTPSVQESADFVDRGVRAGEAPGRQAEQGPRAGLRRPHLHRRRGAVSDDEEAGSRHQGSVRAQRSSSTPRRSMCCARSTRWSSATGTTRTCRCRTSRTKAWSPPAPGRSRSTRWSRKAAGREHRAGRRRNGVGGHHDAARERQASELRLQVARMVDHAEGAGRRRGVVRLGAGRAGGVREATSCSAPKAARPTASITSTRSSSGARRKPRAPRRARCVPYSRWATDYVAMMGGRDAPGSS